MKMKLYHITFLLLLTLATEGCTTWGYKMATGTKTYPKTDFRNVKVLFQPPTQPYEEIGICSVLGGAKFITSDVDMLQKLRKSAADLGADAVILTKEGSTTASISTAAGSSSANLYANPSLATGSATGSWGAYGGTFEYPRNMGIAIKFIQRS
jgi:hypothetical protein